MHGNSGEGKGSWLQENKVDKVQRNALPRIESDCGYGFQKTLNLKRDSKKKWSSHPDPTDDLNALVYFYIILRITEWRIELACIGFMQEMVDAKNEKPHSTINFLPPLTLHSLGCSPAFTWGKATFALNIWILCFITFADCWTTHIHASWTQTGRKTNKIPAVSGEDKRRRREDQKVLSWPRGHARHSACPNAVSYIQRTACLCFKWQ